MLTVRLNQQQLQVEEGVLLADQGIDGRWWLDRKYGMYGQQSNSYLQVLYDYLLAPVHLKNVLVLKIHHVLHKYILMYCSMALRYWLDGPGVESR